MEWELIKQAAELGAVFSLAVLIFLMYRRDRKDTESRLSGLLEADQYTRAKHTQVLTELITYLRNKNGSAK